jgi:hypothetical protein
MAVRDTARVNLLGLLLLAVAILVAPISQASQVSLVLTASARTSVGSAVGMSTAAGMSAAVGIGDEYRPQAAPAVATVGQTAHRLAGRELPGGSGAAVATASWLVVVLLLLGFAALITARFDERRTAPARDRGPPATRTTRPS